MNTYPDKCKFLNSLDPSCKKYIHLIIIEVQKQKPIGTNLFGRINNKLEELNADSANEIIEIWYALSAGICYFNEIDKDILNEITFYNGQTLVDIAYEEVANGNLGEIDKKSNLYNYIDYKAIAKDFLCYNGFEEINEDGIVGVFECRS